MATGYYTNLRNTTVCGSAMVSYLSGDDIKATQFEAAMSNTPEITMGNADHVLTVDELIQAAVSQQLIYNTKVIMSYLTKNIIIN